MKIQSIGKIILGATLAISLNTDSTFAAKPKAKKTIRALAKNGNIIKKLPAASKAVSSKKTKASSLDVSGTPPLLAEMPELPLKTLFWEPGLIDDLNDGTPSQNSCNTFFGGTNDGESAGLGACYLAQNVGYSFETVLQSATSFCYMQKMQSAPSGVTVSGASTVSEALTPPEGTATKIVRVIVTGFPGDGPGEQNIFFEISGQGTNLANGNMYQHKIYFCGEDAAPQSRETATIKNNLEYLISNLGSDEQGDHFSSVSSKITVDNNGKIIFNPNSNRSVEIAFISDSSFFKSSMTIVNNKIKNKTYDSFGSEARKAYTEAKYTGSSIQTLRFTEGGTKDENFSVITEYRDTNYVSAPDNAEFNAGLASVDIDSDSFYTSQASVDTSSLAEFNCDTATPEATITMDFSDSALQEHAASCEENRIDGMDFCNNDDDVFTAEQNFFGQCI